MKSDEQNKHNRNRLTDTENRLPFAWGEGPGGLGEIGEKIKWKNIEKKLIDTDNSLFVCRQYVDNTIFSKYRKI